MLEIERLGTLISMRLLLKLGLFVAGAFFLVLVVAFGWLYFYSHDLPDVRALAQHAPTTVTQVSDQCLGSSVATPYEAIGENLRNAIRASETREDDPGVLRAMLEGLVRDEPRHSRTAIASWFISRTMFCTPSKMLNRRLAEIRTAIQLERHYSRQQLFTIYANRVPLGSGVTGVHDGAWLYFQKNPAELTVADAALLAAVIRGPSWLSPTKHPERALSHRNEVIDAMLENGSITAAQAQAAKTTPLSVAASASATSTAAQ